MDSTLRKENEAALVRAYYDALKQNDDKVAGLIHNALGASIESTIAFLEENGVEA